MRKGRPDGRVRRMVGCAATGSRRSRQLQRAPPSLRRAKKEASHPLSGAGPTSLTNISRTDRIIESRESCTSFLVFACSGMKTPDRLRFCLVGLGRMGQIHLAHLAAFGDRVSIAAVSDARKEVLDGMT